MLGLKLIAVSERGTMWCHIILLMKSSVYNRFRAHLVFFNSPAAIVPKPNGIHQNELTSNIYHDPWKVYPFAIWRRNIDRSCPAAFTGPNHSWLADRVRPRGGRTRVNHKARMYTVTDSAADIMASWHGNAYRPFVGEVHRSHRSFGIFCSWTEPLFNSS